MKITVNVYLIENRKLLGLEGGFAWFCRQKVGILCLVSATPRPALMSHETKGSFFASDATTDEEKSVNIHISSQWHHIHVLLYCTGSLHVELQILVFGARSSCKWGQRPEVFQKSSFLDPNKISKSHSCWNILCFFIVAFLAAFFQGFSRFRLYLQIPLAQ